MGVLRFLVTSLIQGTFIFLLISFLPGLPPNVPFTEFQVKEPVPLEGTLSVNTLLDNAEHLFSGKIHGPEAFVDHKGVLYTGIHGGEIVKIVDGKIVPVTKFGKKCEGFWDEKNCGRPLGMNFGPDGLLYVADAYNGIFKVDVDTGAKTMLVSSSDVIEDKLTKLANSVVVANDGTVYWSCSSTNFELQDGVFDGLADGSGRLLKYDPKTKKTEVLIEGIHFANGVALSPKEDFVLVAETMRSCIHRYYLKGPKKGTRDVFIEGLPGLPDNLKSDGQGGFFVPLVVVRDSNNPIIFQSIGRFPMLRKFLSRVLALFEMAFEQVDRIYPNYYSKRAVHWIGHFESTGPLSPRKGTILLQLDVDGNVKRSFHNTDGSLAGMSEVHWFNGAFYFGSPYNTHIGRVKLSFGEPQPAHKDDSQVKQEAKVQQSEKPSSPSQKPTSPPQQSEKPSSPPQKRSPPPQQPQKPSPPQQPQKPSPPHQQPQKPSPPPEQSQKPSPPPQQPQKSSPPPQQAQKPSSLPSQQSQRTSPPVQQTQKPSPPPQQPQKPSSPTEQPQKPSPPTQHPPKPQSQQPQKPSPPPSQPQKPSPPPRPQTPPPTQKPSPTPQSPPKTAPPPSQPSQKPTQQQHQPRSP